MATGTVKDSEEERKREEEHLELRRELVSVAARDVRSELERSGSGSSHAALLDWRLRLEGLEMLREARRQCRECGHGGRPRARRLASLGLVTWSLVRSLKDG